MSARLTRRFVPVVLSAFLGALLIIGPAGALPGGNGGNGNGGNGNGGGASAVGGSSNPGLNLDQCRNGAALTPNDCDATGWENGNLNSNQAHYVEGQSAPYRLVMEDLPLGETITVVLEYDVMHSGHHAIDFLTQYDRIPEDVVPTDGVDGLSTTTVGTYPIPAPSAVGSLVPGQPTDAFNALPATERVMTLFGGLISGMANVTGGDLATDGNSAARVSVTFVADSSTAVLAWGGHIASPGDWGAGNSASGVSGSPYHMSVFSWTLGNVGHQDRSMQAGVVAPIVPPVPAQLTVTKIVVNDDGGSAVVGDFPLFVNGAPVSSGVANTLTPGTYTVSETNGAGYTGTFDIDGDCASDGSVTLVDGQTAACTLTNDDQPATLTVTKIVTTDDGGSAVVGDFPLFVDGAPVTSGVANTFDAGTYTVSETNGAGYTGTFDIDGDCASDGSVTLSLGETAACTITNDDQPATLTVTKIVVNNDGGTAVVSDFPLFVDGAPVSSGVANTFDAGTYTVSETNRTGYTRTFGGDCDSDGSVTLGLGETAACTITNNDVARAADPPPSGNDDPDTTDPVVDVEVESQTATVPPANPTQPLQAVPVSTPAVPAPVTGSTPTTPVNSGQELPRTGAGLREETLLALALMLAGLSALGLARRRNRPADV